VEQCGFAAAIATEYGPALTGGKLQIELLAEGALPHPEVETVGR